MRFSEFFRYYNYQLFMLIFTYEHLLGTVWHFFSLIKNYSQDCIDNDWHMIVYFDKLLPSPDSRWLLVTRFVMVVHAEWMGLFYSIWVFFYWKWQRLQGEGENGTYSFFLFFFYFLFLTSYSISTCSRPFRRLFFLMSLRFNAFNYQVRRDLSTYEN